MNRIRSANWHITSRCNYSCNFCFAKDLGIELRDRDTQCKILSGLVNKGIEKLNFVGGEPMLHPDILDLVKMGKDLGLVVTIQTNGSLLNDDVLSKFMDHVDWIGISIDSGSEEIERRLGRGHGNHVETAINLCNKINDLGFKLKINTTITGLNHDEDMHSLIEILNPNRWKVFQMLIIDGQNNSAQKNQVSNEDFKSFCRTHSDIVLKNGGKPAFEFAEDMIDSYLMIGPQGEIIRNNKRCLEHRLIDFHFSEIDQKIIDVSKYSARGGVYDW